MPAITIIVEFETVDGAEAEFTRVIIEHARRTLQEEPGCLRFEVVQPMDAEGRPLPNQLMVNELYADQAAVDIHRGTPRMAILADTIKPLVKSKRSIRALAVGAPAVAEGIRPENLNAANDD